MSSPSQRAWERFRRNRRAIISAWFLLALSIAVVVWPLILKGASLGGQKGAAFALQYDPDKVSDEQFLAPGARHWCGTDVHGRDLLSRILFGAQVSLVVGVVGAVVSLVIGVLWGAIAGFAGGRTDSIMMRFVDVLYSLPSIIFVIVLITTLEEGFSMGLNNLSPSVGRFGRLLFLFIGLGAISWLTMARIVRGQVLSLKKQEFIVAARALGADDGLAVVRPLFRRRPAVHPRGPGRD